VARAKRTQRAEARRRYRAVAAAAESAGAAESPDLELDEHDESAARPETTAPRGRGFRARRPEAPVAIRREPGPPPRPGLMAALRHAAGPADVRADLRALPSITIRSKALWVPLALIAGVTALFFLPGISRNPLVALLGNLALQPPPMILPFLGGMLAPRGAWLVGGIVALANAVAYGLLFGVFTNSVQTGLGFTYLMTSDQKVSVIANAILTSVPFGLLVGAFAGFYRRFLAMSAPARPAPARSKRPDPKRR
jgi:hypothetical protein